MKALFTMILLVLTGSLFAQIYVKQDAAGNNDGTSWADAYKSLQNAINAAPINSEIWVAKGTYKPTQSRSNCSDCSGRRDWTFFINKDIKLYGGFEGNELQLAARNPALNRTILSGDFNGDDTIQPTSQIFLSFDIINNTENAFHVLFVSNLTEASLIDGFFITGGNANSGNTSSHRGSGGGVIIDNASLRMEQVVFSRNAASSGGAICAFDAYDPLDVTLKLKNVHFTENRAYKGGAVDVPSASSVQIKESSFENNTASYAGGLAVRNVTNLDIENVSFEKNTALEGGGFYATECSVLLRKVSFKDNSGIRQAGALNLHLNTRIEADSLTINSNGSQQGGGIYLFANNYVQITNSTFLNNGLAQQGGAIASWGNDTLILDRVHVEGNSAEYNGGGILSISENLFIRNSHFINNTSFYSEGGAVSMNGGTADIQTTEFLENSAISGGGLYTANIKSSLKDVLFSKNSSYYDGGAIKAQRSNFLFNQPKEILSLTNVTLSENQAGRYGGAIYNKYQALTMSNSKIIGNRSTFGGGLYSDNVAGTYTNTLFSENESDKGGAIYNFKSSPIFVNTTIAANRAFQEGSVFYNEASSPQFFNSILWASDEKPFYNEGTEKPTLSYSLLKGTASGTTWNEAVGIDGGGNISDAPLFENEPTDLRLSIESPAINTGNRSFNNTLLDLEQKPRIFGKIIDIGAYETEVLPSVLQLFPNPADDFTIITLGDIAQEKAEVVIFDAKGQIVNSFTTTEPQVQLSTSRFANGTYFIKIKIGNQHFVNKLIVTH